MIFQQIEDVRVENGVLRLDIPLNEPLPAATWTFLSGGEVRQSRVIALAHAINQLAVGTQLWLLCAHRALQGSNRITRYNGLWKSFKAGGLELPPSPETFEHTIEMEKGLRCFGARRLSREKLNGVDPIMRSEDGSIAVFQEDADPQWIKELVQNGWHANTIGKGPPTNVILRALENGAAVLDVFGAFDDFDVTAALMGRAPVLDTLLTR